MTIEDGLLLKGTRIIVPNTLHPEMIQLLHTGHLRYEKCLNRAKQSMYWPGLYEELKELVTNCTTCLKFSSQKPTCLSNRQYTGHEIPVHPWSKLASNISYFECCCITFFYRLTDVAVIVLLDAIVEAMSDIRESL